MTSTKKIFEHPTMRNTQSSRRTPPKWLIALLMLTLGLQAIWKAHMPPPTPHFQDFNKPPTLEWLRLTTLGDPITMATVWMLWLQTFDDQAGVVIPFQKMDFHHLATWLETILALNPRSEYPLFAAIRVYGFVPNPDKQRTMLHFVHRAYRQDPKHRWPWLALAAVQARHRLNDNNLARSFMDDMQQNIIANELPFWVRGLHARILSEQNELNGARAIMGGLLLHETMSERQKQSMAIWLEKLEDQEKNLNNEKKNNK